MLRFLGFGGKGEKVSHVTVSGVWGGKGSGVVLLRNAVVGVWFSPKIYSESVLDPILASAYRASYFLAWHRCLAALLSGPLDAATLRNTVALVEREIG